MAKPQSKYTQPAEPISQKERRARAQETLGVLADLKRQDTAPLVQTMAVGPRLLRITVPDQDDWVAFCADLLTAGQMQWWLQGDRET